MVKIYICNCGTVAVAPDRSNYSISSPNCPTCGYTIPVMIDTQELQCIDVTYDAPENIIKRLDEVADVIHEGTPVLFFTRSS